MPGVSELRTCFSKLKTCFPKLSLGIEFEITKQNQNTSQVSLKKLFDCLHKGSDSNTEDKLVLKLL